MCFFFFSSRRRHTRSLRDWSSDVCSSDLAQQGPGPGVGQVVEPGRLRDICPTGNTAGTACERPIRADGVAQRPDDSALLLEAELILVDVSTQKEFFEFQLVVVKAAPAGVAVVNAALPQIGGHPAGQA